MSAQVEQYISLKLDNQMKIVAGMLRNMGLDGMRLTLVARHPTDGAKFIIKTDDELPKVAALLEKP